MRKFITPFNLTALVLLGFAIYGAIVPGSWGFGFLATLYLTPIALLFIGADLFIRFLTTEKILLISQLGILSMLYGGFEYSERTKTFIIPDNPDYEFIVTVYELDNQEELPTSLLTWNYELTPPDHGIILTSTAKFKDLPQTNIQTKSGIRLNDRTDDSDLCFGRVGTGAFQCGATSYQYSAWKLDSGGAISYSSNDITELEKRLCDFITLNE